MYHTILSFKYNSIFSIFTDIVTIITVNFKTFLFPQKETISLFPLGNYLPVPLIFLSLF